MSNISPRPEQSTTTEAALLTSINELSNSASGEFIRKAGGVFVNATPGATSVSFIDLTDTPSNYTDAASKTLKVNAGGDAIEFVDVATGATTALNNLASVAINTSLVSDTTNTDDLGSSTKLWKDLFVTNIGATGTRVTKGWFTDLEVTNAIAGSITGNAATVTNATLTTALTVNTGTVTLTGNAANSSVLTIGAGEVSVSGSNTGDQTSLSGISDTKANFDIACSDGNFLYVGDAPTAHAASHAVSGADTVFPADPGADRYLMWDDNPGELVWAEVTGTGANTALSNLSSVAINTSLIPGADVSVNMGTGDLRYKDMWIETISSGLTAADTLKLRGRDIDGTAYVDILTITSNNTVTADLNAITTIGGNAIIYSGGELGTPSGGTLTNCSGLPVSGITDSTSEALGVGSIELGHASDTTLSRSAGGVLQVEGVRVITSSGTTSGTILKNNGTTFVASTETYAAPGASGNVMTSDGTNWISAANKTSFTPSVLFSTCYETQARHSLSDYGGTATFNNYGLVLDTTAVKAKGYRVFTYANYTNSSNFGYPTATMSVCFKTIGTDVKTYHGLGDVTISATDITGFATSLHAGFKLVRASSGDANLYATQSGGSSETVSGVLTTVSAGDHLDFVIKVGASSVDYYWRKNAGSWSSATTLSSNNPTQSTRAHVIHCISNVDVATQSVIYCYSSSVER